MTAARGAALDVWVAAVTNGTTETVVGRVLESYAANDNRTVQLGRDSRGRPEVRGRNGLTVSVSHTVGMMLVAVGTGCRAGIDVEIVRDRGLLCLPRHALSASELLELARIEPAGQLAGFLSYWVRKEALLKAAGFGLIVEPAQIELPPPRRGSQVISAPAALGRIDRWVVEELEIEGYAAAFAADVPPSSLRVIPFRPDARTH